MIKVKEIISIVILILLFTGITTAQIVDAGIPPIPYEYFYGTVTINDVPAPNGTSVSAWINGVEKASAETEIIENEAWYPYLKVKGKKGDLVVFKIYNTVVDNETFVPSKWTRKDLSLNITEIFTLSGYVKYECNGTVIDHANVTLENGVTNLTITNETGYYELKASAGEYNLIAAKDDVWDGTKYISFLNGSTTVNLNENKTVNLSLAIKGDLDNDCAVTMEDVKMVASMVIGSVTEGLRADFNENGYVDVGDAAKLLGYVKGGVDRL
jgi:hypothetical protein